MTEKSSQSAPLSLSRPQTLEVDPLTSLECVTTDCSMDRTDSQLDTILRARVKRGESPAAEKAVEVGHGQENG